MGFWREIFPKVDETYDGYSEYDGDYDADYSDIDPREAQRNYTRTGRRMKIAGIVAAVAVAGGSLVIWAGSDNKPRNSVSADQTPGGEATIDSGNTATASPSPSESESATDSPSPTHTEKASPTPSETSASPTPTKTHVIIPATPTPEITTSAPAEETYGACHINSNASSPDYRHRESICDKPVTAYTDSDGATQAFEVNGPVEFNCLDAERGYVEASISNAVGWVALPNLANDICN
jgi:hypothetical protein